MKFECSKWIVNRLRIINYFPGNVEFNFAICYILILMAMLPKSITNCGLANPHSQTNEEITELSNFEFVDLCM